MQLHVNADSPLPIYAQLVEQIRHAVATGELPEGEGLPTVRQLAVDLRVNMHTVARAYSELAREGLLAVRRGVGTYVQGRPQPLDPEERERRLLEIMRDALGQAATLGLGPDEFVQALAAYARGVREGSTDATGC
jgi:GntR family transcriptional regulator